MIMRLACLAIILFSLGACTTNNHSKRGDQPVVRQEAGIQTDTAIFYAALHGDLSKISQIMEKGGQVNLTDRDNRTALMYASFNGHTDMVRFLLEKGSDVNLTDINRRTALMFAASGPFESTVRLLLEKGADPDLQDMPERFTALMYAASEGQADVVKTLLTFHADPFLRDADGDMALTFAENNGHLAVVKILSALPLN